MRGFAFHSVILKPFSMPGKEVQERTLLWVAIAAATCIQISIAASEILLGVGILLNLLFRQKLRFPRVWVPLVCLFLWTALADVVSPDPWLGRAQIKKFYVFLFIPLIYPVFARQFEKVYYLVAAWAAAASASAAVAIGQYIRSAHAAYIAYVGKRITGFESHWMTFGALQLSVLLLLLAQWFFSSRRLPWWAYASVPLLSAAILLGGTRSIWLAAFAATLYLAWTWRPRMVLAVPVLAVAALLAAPHNVKERALSLVRPQQEIDSNRHRSVTFVTGVEMIKAHPIFGLGPEEIGRNFLSYVPRDVPRPLPVGYYGHLHNIYLQYAAERGIPGLLFVLWFIGLALWDFVRGIFAVRAEGRACEELAHSGRGRAGRVPLSFGAAPGGLCAQHLFVLHGAIAVILAILVGGIFEYNLGDSEVLMMFLCVVSLGYAALEDVRKRGVTIEEAA